ncbi:hypothetical protein L207DRAFT_446513, partial [Hyaloscypha variabilis F]
YINSYLFDYFNIFYTIYLNNILIYLDNELKYKVYIKKVLDRLYKFSIKKTKYLSFIISTNSILVNLNKV